MRIVTYSLMGDDTETVHALTAAEHNNAPHVLAAAEEYVWQEQDTKEAAIARHDEAMDLWVIAGRPSEGVF